MLDPVKGRKRTYPLNPRGGIPVSNPVLPKDSSGGYLDRQARTLSGVSADRSTRPSQGPDVTASLTFEQVQASLDAIRRCELAAPIENSRHPINGRNQPAKEGTFGAFVLRRDKKRHNGPDSLHGLHQTRVGLRAFLLKKAVTSIEDIFQLLNLAQGLHKVCLGPVPF